MTKEYYVAEVIELHETEKAIKALVILDSPSLYFPAWLPKSQCPRMYEEDGNEFRDIRVGKSCFLKIPTWLMDKATSANVPISACTLKFRSTGAIELGYVNDGKVYFLSGLAPTRLTYNGNLFDILEGAAIPGDLTSEEHSKEADATSWKCW